MLMKAPTPTFGECLDALSTLTAKPREALRPTLTRWRTFADASFGRVLALIESAATDAQPIYPDTEIDPVKWIERRLTPYGEIASRAKLHALGVVLKRTRAPKVRSNLPPWEIEHRVRRSLEVAILSAEIAKHDREQDEASIGWWPELRDRADRADKAVQHLLEWLGGSARRRHRANTPRPGQTRFGNNAAGAASGIQAGK